MKHQSNKLAINLTMIYSIALLLSVMTVDTQEAYAAKPSSFELVTLLNNEVISGSSTIEVPSIDVSDAKEINFLATISAGAGPVNLLVKFGDSPSFNSTVAINGFGLCIVSLNGVERCKVEGDGSSSSSAGFIVVQKFKVTAPYLLLTASNSNSSDVTITLKAYITK